MTIFKSITVTKKFRTNKGLRESYPQVELIDQDGNVHIRNGKYMKKSNKVRIRWKGNDILVDNVR